MNLDFGVCFRNLRLINMVTWFEEDFFFACAGCLHDLCLLDNFAYFF